MAETTGVEWADATWNPWQGCTKVSEACRHCYMFRDMARYGKKPDEVRRSAPPTFNLPLKKHRDGTPKIPDGHRVFTCSWSDWFHKDADEWRPEAWQICRQRPGVTFMIVTKRTHRIRECLPPDWGDGYPNVWLIATVESQEWLSRARELVQIPAVVHGLSCEPMLGPIDLGPRITQLDWVISGGESGGREARPMHPDWARGLRDQCQLVEVPFFFKQWGEWSPECDAGKEFGEAVVTADGGCYDPYDAADHGVEGATMFKVGKAAAGRLLDGREWSEFPQVDVFR